MAETYVVSGTLRHGDADGTIHTYKNGDEFSHDDPSVVEPLRLAGTLMTPEEFARAEANEGRPQLLQELGLQRQSLEDENASLKARIAELEAGQSKGGKKSGDDSAQG